MSAATITPPPPQEDDQQQQEPLNDLVTKVRAAHPGAYDHIDDATLTKKVLDKYPQYAPLAAPKLTVGSPSQSPLAKDKNPSGEGPIAQGLTTMETKFADIPQSIAHAIKTYPVDPIRAMGQTSAKENLKAINPIDTHEGNLAMNIGGTAAKLLPLVIDPAGGGITESPAADMIGAAKNSIPSTVRAGGKFNEVMGAAKTIPIDTAAAGDVALNIQKLAESGGAMPKVIRDFVRRATDPNKGPITYEEARNFYSNASRLSADETNRLTPNMKRNVGEFTSQLGKTIQDAAAQGGKGPEFQQAMQEYRNAMRLKKIGSNVKDTAIKAAANTIPYAGAAYAAHKIFSGK